MRRILISLLLASVAASPALANPNDKNDRQQAREQRQQAHQERAQGRAERPSFAPAPRFEPQAQMHEQAVERPQYNRPERFQPQVDRREQAVERPQYNRPERFQPQVDPNAMREARRESFDAERGQRMQQMQMRQQEMRDSRNLRQSQRAMPEVMRTPHPLVVSNTPRPGTQPPLRAVNRPTPPVQWNTGWRDDDRYDWRDYRRDHGSIFHLSIYYDPFGWGYQPYQIGWRLWPAYYSQNFWIMDPWMYRLPYPPPGYVWVRYWNDALLVDTWTGTVVDVIPGFFW